MEEFDYNLLLDLAEVKTGDLIDVASDLRALIWYCDRHGLYFDANHLIDCMKLRVSEEGTVMIRIFNWDFCHGVPFNKATSPGKCGTLGNVALERKDFVRTNHPIYSWMVWGKYADALCSLNNTSGFGKDSVFDFLYRHDGVEIALGKTSTVATTQVHHCEKMAQVPYRFEKQFKGKYIELDGKVSERTYSMYVRPFNVDVSNDITETPHFSEVLQKKGILLEQSYEGIIRCRRFDLHKLTDFIMNDLVNGDGSLTVSIEGKAGYKNSNIDWESLIF